MLLPGLLVLKPIRSLYIPASMRCKAFMYHYFPPVHSAFPQIQKQQHQVIMDWTHEPRQTFPLYLSGIFFTESWLPQWVFKNRNFLHSTALLTSHQTKAFKLYSLVLESRRRVGKNSLPVQWRKEKINANLQVLQPDQNWAVRGR